LFSSTRHFDPLQSIEQKTIDADTRPKELQMLVAKKSSLQLANFGSRPTNHFSLLKFLSTKSNEACSRVVEENGKKSIKSHISACLFSHLSVGGGVANVEMERMAEMKRHTQRKKEINILITKISSRSAERQRTPNIQSWLTAFQS
jgi:hypothetical protein